MNFNEEEAKKELKKCCKYMKLALPIKEIIERKLFSYDEIFQQEATDLALLTGGLRKFYWLQNAYCDSGLIMAVDADIDGITRLNSSGYGVCIRPILYLPSIYHFLFYNVFKNDFSVKEIEYGEYPQNVASDEISELLETKFKSKNLKTTGKYYTFNSKREPLSGEGFRPATCHEYQLNEKKYIRLKDNAFYCSRRLSNNKNYENGDYVWLEVSPITWIVNHKEGILLSKKSLLSGIDFDNIHLHYDDNFKSTAMYKYLNGYMSKNIIPSIVSNIQELRQTSTSQLNLSSEAKEMIYKINQKSLKSSNRDLYLSKLEQILTNYQKGIDESRPILKNDVLSLKPNIQVVYATLISELNSLYLDVASDIYKLKDMIESSLNYLTNGQLNELIFKEVIDINELIKEFDLDSNKKYKEQLCNILNVFNSKSITNHIEKEKTEIDLRQELLKLLDEVKQYKARNELKISEKLKIDAIYDENSKSVLKEYYLLIKGLNIPDYLKKYEELVLKYKLDLNKNNVIEIIKKFYFDLKILLEDVEFEITKRNLLQNINKLKIDKNIKQVEFSDINKLTTTKKMIILLGIESYLKDIMTIYNDSINKVDSVSKNIPENYISEILIKCEDIIKKDISYESLKQIARLYLELKIYLDETVNYCNILRKISI